MNPRKSSKTLALALLAVLGLIAFGGYSTVTAHSGYRGQEAPTGSVDRQHFFEMREIMHYARVESTAIENGVRVTVTSEDKELAEAIVREFTGERHQAVPPAPGVNVEAQKLENGTVLIYTASDPSLASWLQARGATLVYNQLRENMHESMAGPEGRGGWGFGWMHGWMGQGMHGPGGNGMHGPGGYGMGGWGR